MLRYLAGVAGFLLLGLANLAQAQSYAQHSTPIRAGIVVIDSAQTASGQPINSTPFVWYNLDSNTSVKPAGWNIYNPDATTQVSPAVASRWGQIGVDLGFGGPALGSGLTKSSAAYWEVMLSQVGDAQLSDYDVLLVSAYNLTSLNSMERDRLRKFADQGGVLWIDVSSSTGFNGNEVNTFPLPFETISLGPTGLTNSDPYSPLTSTPYTLSLASLDQMRVDRSSYATSLSQAGVSATSWDIESWLVSDYFMHFDTVASRNGNPSIMMGKLGSGYVVVTTSGYAQTLNRVKTAGGYNANNFFYGLAPTYDNSNQLAAKFAINLISLGSGFAQPGGSARHQSSIAIDLGPPLLKATEAEIGMGMLPNQAPVLYKGLFVVASGSTLKVFDAKPGTDLDGDGNPDDGLQDFSLGATYDELWESTLPTTISGPTCAEIPNSAHKDQIFVTGANGHVYAFDAFNLNNNGIIVGSNSVTPLADIAPPAGISGSSFGSGQAQQGPYAPTFFDGLLYMTDVQNSPVTGAVWVADPSTETTVKTGGTSEWLLGCATSQTLPEPTGSPTIGYIPVQDGSGAYDRVMYFPGRPTSVIGPTGTASITSLWMGVRGENPGPGSVELNHPEGLWVRTRAGTTGLPIYDNSGVSFGATANRSLGIKLTLIHPNGDPYTNAEMAANLQGTVAPQNVSGFGILVFPWKAGVGGTLEPNVGVRVDYSIDWGQAAQGNTNLTPQIIRGQLYLPDDYINVFSASDRRCILGNIAMSPRGTIYCVTSTQYLNTDAANNTKDGGSYYAIREDIGRGGFRLLTRFQLYPRHNIPLNQATPVNYEQTLEDSDPVQNLLPAFMNGKDFSHLTFMSAPSVRNGVVYVTALGRKDNGAPFPMPYSILMAFKADPDPPEIKVSGSLPNGFSLRQYDIDRSGSHVNPTAPNDMTAGQFTYERDQGIIRFDSLMSTNRGPMVSAFSTSQPVVLRQPNAPDQLIEPDKNYNRWTPLLWYSVMHGIQPTPGTPLVSGGSVFVPGMSIIPNLAQYLSNGTIQFSGMVEAWNATVSPNDSYIGSFPDGSRPWIKQLFQIQFNGPNPTPNPDMLWPQLTGLRDFSDYLIRARQTKLGISTTCFGIVGGDGMFGAWGDFGAYTFSKADFIVADEGRLARFDSNGNPLWISSAASSNGLVDNGSVGAVKPLVRPVRAYPIGTGDIVVVDPGANRVARIDLSGREIRSITGFALPPTIPDGFQANEPLTLNSPRDVAVYNTYEVGGTQLWVHYLIADAGNKRLVDVVDQYAVNANHEVVGNPLAIGVLNWHTPANFSGKDFDYNSISRVYDPVSNLYFIAAGIGSGLPTRVNTGLDSPVAGTGQPIESKSGNGGIVIFDQADPSKNVIVNQIVMPDIAANTYWDFNMGTFNSPFRASHNKTLTNVSSITAKTVFDQATMKARVTLMITDATGVYEVWLQDPNNDPTTPWFVRWMMTNQAYQGLRHLGNNAPLGSSPLDLRATYARRLDDGDVLVVNGYEGKTRGGNDFMGEVLQIDGEFSPVNGAVGFDFNKPNFGFDLNMIVFQLPPIQGARGLVLPVFADRR